MSEKTFELEKYKENSTVETLRAYAMDTEGEIRLTPTQERIWQAVVFSDTMFQEYYNTTQIKAMIVKRYGVTDRTAQNYVSIAQEIFGGARKPNSDYVSGLFLNQLQDAIRRARSSNDLKLEADLLKTFQRYVSDITSKEVFMPDIPKLVVVVTDPTQIGLEDINVERLRRNYEKKHNNGDIEEAVIINP